MKPVLRWLPSLPLLVIILLPVALVLIPIWVGRVGGAERFAGIRVALLVLAALVVVLIVGWILRRVDVLHREVRYRVETEASLHHVARTLSGAVSVQEVAQQAARDAVRSTRAFGAYLERARDGVVEVVAAEGVGTPSLGMRLEHDNSLTAATAGATEPTIQMKPGAIGQSVASYLRDRCHGCSALIVPLSVQEGAHGAHAALVLLTAAERGDFTASETAYARALGDLVTAAMRRMLLLEREHHARTEAEAAVRDRDQVLRVVSHDLKNPLHTIGMVAQLLVDMPLSDAERQRQLQIVRRTVDRMNRLVRDLLDGARVQSGNAITIVPTSVETAPLISDAVDQFREQARDNGQQLDGEVAEGVQPVLADRDRLLQVFSNLIGNALKFTPEGGRVRIRAEPEREGVVRFSVADTGPGIPAESLAHLFEPFWQARDRATLGTGLGLSIARGIVEAHGGRISVASTPGEGSIFVFNLPVAREPGALRSRD
jgi:signal transduction histidine kinase